MKKNLVYITSLIGVTISIAFLSIAGGFLVKIDDTSGIMRGANLFENGLWIILIICLVGLFSFLFLSTRKNKKPTFIFSVVLIVLLTAACLYFYIGWQSVQDEIISAALHNASLL